jgi:hypothetical protein
MNRAEVIEGFSYRIFSDKNMLRNWKNIYIHFFISENAEVTD